jgi:hypothetical protein
MNTKSSFPSDAPGTCTPGGFVAARSQTTKAVSRSGDGVGWTTAFPTYGWQRKTGQVAPLLLPRDRTADHHWQFPEVMSSELHKSGEGNRTMLIRSILYLRNKIIVSVLCIVLLLLLLGATLLPHTVAILSAIPEDLEHRLDRYSGYEAAVPMLKAMIRFHVLSVNATGSNGWTPMSYAAANGDAKTVEWLLDRGGKLDKANLQSGLEKAIDRVLVDDVREALRMGADPRKPNIFSGETPLQRAYRQYAGVRHVGAQEIIQMLESHN